jgi:GNAT superfamily N-acetyltransferase
MSLLSDTPGRLGSLEAQKLLDVPVPGGFAVWLDEHWRAELQAFLERCGEDVALLLGKPPGPDVAERLLNELPPGRTFEDKFVVGVFDGRERMVGILVVVRDHPEAAHWTVELLLVAPDQRGHGLAREMLASLEGWARSEGGRALHLAARRHNPAGAGFALRAGFERAPGQSADAVGVRYVRLLA